MDKIIKIATLIFWVLMLFSILALAVESIDRMVYRRIQTSAIEENTRTQEKLLKVLKESNK